MKKYFLVFQHVKVYKNLLVLYIQYEIECKRSNIAVIGKQIPNFIFANMYLPKEAYWTTSYTFVQTF